MFGFKYNTVMNMHINLHYQLICHMKNRQELLLAPDSEKGKFNEPGNFSERKELSRFILSALFFFPLHMPAWDALLKAEIV